MRGRGGKKTELVGGLMGMHWLQSVGCGKKTVSENRLPGVLLLDT